MGLAYAEITLINGEDISLARRHVIGEDEIKQMTVTMLVDTGAVNLCINESIQVAVATARCGKTEGANGRQQHY